jgi:hypothetical protein
MLDVFTPVQIAVIAGLMLLGAVITIIAAAPSDWVHRVEKHWRDKQKPDEKK